MVVDRMLARFCWVWLAYWLVFLLQPVRSIFPEVQSALIVQLAFVAAVAVSFGIVQRAKAPRCKGSLIRIQPLERSLALSVVRVGYAVSAVGLALLLFDKVIVQGIDYSGGVASARQQWFLQGQERGGGVSSIFSGLGYFAGSAYFLSLAVVFSRKIDLPDRQRLRLILIGFLFLLANSLITGGRSGILLAVVFISYAYFTRDQQGARPLFRRRIYRLAPLLIFGLCVSYVLYIFNARATAGDVDVAYYSFRFLGFLGLEAYDSFERFVDGLALGWPLALVNLAVSYLTHSFATMAAIIEFDGEGGQFVFGHLKALLAKIGLVTTNSAESYLPGRFASLPGGLYHQFGLLGMLVAAILLGSFGGWIRGSYKWRRSSISALFLCCIFEAILIASPFLFVGDSMFFPFLIVGGLLSLTLVGLARHRVP